MTTSVHDQREENTFTWFFAYAHKVCVPAGNSCLSLSTDENRHMISTATSGYIFIACLILPTCHNIREIVCFQAHLYWISICGKNNNQRNI